MDAVRKILKVFLFLYCANVFALTQYEKLWLGVNGLHSLSQDKKWVSFIFTQLRLIDLSHPVQTGLLEGGIGYYFWKQDTIWMGYRYMGQNPYNNYYTENRLFQQIINVRRPEFLPVTYTTLRTRVEEIQRTDQPQIAVRLRERIAFETKQILFQKARPFIYDEFFVPLNHTNYTAHTVISENRIFLGVNWYRTKQSWWEIGYINQYQVNTPLQKQNQMSHILSITYNYS
jgi:hypothetical protein